MQSGYLIYSSSMPLRSWQVLVGFVDTCAITMGKRLGTGVCTFGSSHTSLACQWGYTQPATNDRFIIVVLLVSMRQLPFICAPQVVDFSSITSMYGAVHCCTQVLRRQSKMRLGWPRRSGLSSGRVSESSVLDAPRSEPQSDDESGTSIPENGVLAWRERIVLWVSSWKIERILVFGEGGRRGEGGGALIWLIHLVCIFVNRTKYCMFVVQ